MAEDRIEEAAQIAAELAGIGAAGRLAWLRRHVSGRIVFTTSLGLEDQVLTHLIAEAGLDIALATLDTGRLFPETYALWRETETRYGLRIHAHYPRHETLEALVARDGIEGFYASVEARKACCGVRKVEPLGRALAGAEAWVTGLRADQSTARGGARFAEWDAALGVLKVNPLLDWTREDALAFATHHAVPINPLHADGFLSIGCAPCTRAVLPGEGERDGRWWWENGGKRECGLHLPEAKTAGIQHEARAGGVAS